MGTLLGRTIQSSYQVTAFEPGRSFEGTMTSPMFGFSEQYRFEPDGQATRVSMTATAGPHGVFRFSPAPQRPSALVTGQNSLHLANDAAPGALAARGQGVSAAATCAVSSELRT